MQPKKKTREKLQPQEIAGLAILAFFVGALTLAFVGTNCNRYKNQYELIFSYEEDTETYALTSVNIAASTGVLVEIPAEYSDGTHGNRPVTVIKKGAFSSDSKKLKYLKSVIIPDSVTCIESGAFAHCVSLENVTIGSGVTYIGSAAFEDCGKLSAVTFKNADGWSVYKEKRHENDVTYEEFERSVNVGDGATAAEKLKDYSRCDIYDENADRYVCYYEWRRK